MKQLIAEDGSVYGTVGGGCVEADVYDAAMEVLRTGNPRLLEFSLTEKGLPGGGLVCGGTVKVFVEPILTPVVYLFGAGHVSLAVSRVAACAGFRVVVLDDRAAFADPERFPDASQVEVLPSFDQALSNVALTLDAYLVIVTRGHQHDELVLRQVLAEPVAYLGLIGSRAKLARLLGKLESEGVDPEKLARVRGPIGLDIGARSPEEIAVAIVAEMVAVRQGVFPQGSSGGWVRSCSADRGEGESGPAKPTPSIETLKENTKGAQV